MKLPRIARVAHSGEYLIFAFEDARLEHVAFFNCGHFCSLGYFYPPNQTKTAWCCRCVKRENTCSICLGVSDAA